MRSFFWTILSILAILSLLVSAPVPAGAMSTSANAQFVSYISGRVTDENGNGISGVTILAVLDPLYVYLPLVSRSGSTTAVSTSSRQSGQNFYSVQTDWNGYYLLNSLPPGRYRIMARKAGMDFDPLSYVVNTTTGGDQYHFQKIIIPTEYKPGTVVLSDETLNQLMSVSENTYTFASLTDDLSRLQVGDVIIGGVSDLTPEGFIGKVVSITTGEEQIVVTTEPATLVDAFENLSVDIAQQLSPDQIQNLAETPGVTLLQSPSSAGSGNFEFAFNDAVLYDRDGDLSTVNDQIVANGLLSLSPEIEFRLLIRNGVIEELYYTATMNVSTEFGVSSKISQDIPIIEKELVPTIRLQPIPVGPLWLTPEIDLFAGISGSVSAGISTYITNTTSFTAGLWHLNNETKKLSNYESNFSFNPLSFDANVSFAAFVGPQVSVKINGIGGGDVKGRFALDLTVAPTADPWLTLKGGLEVSVGAGVTIPIFNKVLLDIRLDAIRFWITLFSLSHSSPITTPVSLPIAAGGTHTCALTASGGVKCWGSNFWGKLGDGTTTDRNTPVDVVGLTSGVQAIAAGGEHTCALNAFGGVKCWGNNDSGQLGDGTTGLRRTPVDVVGLASGVQAIALGVWHTCALTASGGVKCWGDNRYGQLGDGTDTNRPTPVDVVGLTSGVQAIAAGAHHTCALTASGGVKCWGYNWDGQLGDGTTDLRRTPVDVVGLASGVQAITAGSAHTCALTASGDIKCWGNNWNGQLGDGTTTQYRTPVDVVGLASGVQTIDAGGGYTCALTASGGIKCWGSNFWGQLGDGTTTDRNTPVDVVGLTSGVQAITAGIAHTCALTASGGVKCWGYNDCGQLGDGTRVDRLTPVDVVGFP